MDRSAGRNAEGGPCEVHFWMEDEGARTSVASDLHSVCWEDGDHLALWAFKPNHSQALSAQDFAVYGRSNQRAFFSSTLDSSMEEGTYTYWAASPLPSKVQDEYVYFSIPSEQNGKGAGVMFSDLVQAGPLKKQKEQESERLALQMNQRLHLLRFYVQDDNLLLGGEDIEKIQFVFSSDVTGTLRVALPISNTPGVYPSSEQTLQNGSSSLNLQLDQRLKVSSGTERHYAFATIFPRQWGPDDSFSARLYGQSKIAIVDDVLLGGRNMRVSHATSVKLVPNRLREYCRIFINFRSNPIGEPIQSITLTAPSGCRWGDRGGNTYTISTGGNILPGDSFLLEYEDASVFRTLSGKTITVTYDSEHLVTSQTLKMADLSSVHTTTMNLDVPPLLDENFSNVSSFSSNDAYSGGAIAGSMSAYSFLNGWSGGRCGAEAGKCVRLAARRETSARYPSRIDSAPLTGTLKKTTNLKVSFDYGANNQYSTAILTTGDLGQTCYVGYITTTSNPKSGDSTGAVDPSFHVESSDKTGSYNNTPNDTTVILKNVPSGQSVIRICWRTQVDSNAGLTNTTSWLYIDNVKVTIQP